MKLKMALVTVFALAMVIGVWWATRGADTEASYQRKITASAAAPSNQEQSNRTHGPTENATLATEPRGVKDLRVSEFEGMVAAFERDAAEFRAAHSVYAASLTLVRDRLAPLLIDSKLAKLRIGAAIGAEITFGDEEALTKVRQDVLTRCGQELYFDLIFRERARLMSDAVSQLNDLWQARAVSATDDEREKLAHSVKIHLMQRAAAEESGLPAVSEVFPDPESIDYLMFQSDLGDLLGVDGYVGMLIRLPDALARRRDDIEAKRSALYGQQLLAGEYESEYVEPYHRALRDALQPVSTMDDFPRSAREAMSGFDPSFLKDEGHDGRQKD